MPVMFTAAVIICKSKMTRYPSWLENKFSVMRNFTGYFGANEILSMSAKGMKKINSRYNITFQESENAKRLWMPHKHTHPALYSVCLLVLPLVVRKVLASWVKMR